MKLHYPKILLFFFLLNILVTSYQAHNTNKPYITPHHTQTNRSLCEGDTQSSNYDKDTGMKSVMQQFVARTSQRFEEYQERMKDKRQKRKEERDKNIQKIIEEDKREKSLAEKIERGCLRCGCALGGVAASVGVFGGLGIYGSEMAATAVAAKAAGIAEGLKVGLEKVIAIAGMSLEGQQDKIPAVEMLQPLTAGKFTDGVTLRGIFQCISSDVDSQLRGTQELFFKAVDIAAKTTPTEFNSMYGTPANAVAKSVTKGKADAIIATHAEYAHLYSAIGYSVLAILIIVLVMIIIYLVLRYRRKKKKEKKDQYTKLLKE
ncbi:rifin PIR protein, putative [Plasmodium reichenowi]|uniref:Rifin PIR protein, putative n=1 Tax=Plasmodium reichenowi TaxID=5854 RepID=A0A2P9D3Z0_PLARE|nr:rifin PIR protein, putative [Plasmodium reichenowi]